MSSYFTVLLTYLRIITIVLSIAQQSQTQKYASRSTRNLEIGIDRSENKEKVVKSLVWSIALYEPESFCSEEVRRKTDFGVLGASGLALDRLVMTDEDKNS